MDAFEAEQAIIKILKGIQHHPKKTFSGETECFQIEGFPLEKTIKLIKVDSKKKDIGLIDAMRYKLTEKRIRETDPLKKHHAILKKMNEMAQAYE